MIILKTVLALPYCSLVCYLYQQRWSAMLSVPEWNRARKTTRRGFQSFDHRHVDKDRSHLFFGQTPLVYCNDMFACVFIRVRGKLDFKIFTRYIGCSKYMPQSALQQGMELLMGHIHHGGILQYRFHSQYR